MKIRRSCSICGAAIAGGILGGSLVKKLWLAKYRSQRMALETAERERDILYTWLLLHRRGVSLKEYFIYQGYSKVAVLGMERVGRLLLEELGSMAVYGVEADNLCAIHDRLVVYRLGDDPLPPADCLVICGIEGETQKCEAAKREFAGKVVKLTELLSWLLEKHQIYPRNGAIEGWP